MIILDENNNPLINPDLTKGQLYSEWRSVFHRYVVDAEAESHEEVVAEYPNGGKDVAIVIDVPEKGHWETRLESGDLVDFSGTIPDDAPHDAVLQDHEPVMRYRFNVPADATATESRISAERTTQPAVMRTATTEEGEPATMDKRSSIGRWAAAAAIRAVKTAAQAVITLIGADLVSIVALDWPQMLGVAATMAVVSLLTSVAGIPEVDEGANVASIARSN